MNFETDIMNGKEIIGHFESVGLFGMTDKPQNLLAEAISEKMNYLHIRRKQ